MEPEARVRLIQGVRDKIQPMPWGDEDLLLDEFGIGRRPVQEIYGDRWPLTDWLRQASEADLVALARHLEVLPDASSGTTAEEEILDLPSEEPEAVFIFASHLSSEREYVGGVERALRQRYGIEMFVAHDSIPMDATWQPEIAAALARCHAAVAFIHSGFSQSAYCQQEVGWILGRGIPIARYMFGEAPVALLSQRQGKPVKRQDVESLADEILDYLSTKEELRGHLVTSLANALVESPNFDTTDRIWAAFPKGYPITTQQATVLIHAAESQNQVYWKGLRHGIADLLETEPAAEPLSERVARLRREGDSGRRIIDA